tara:strand:- start:2906 stop:4060 length:1155 start_codon:yes stop_codon:yes gene_type:complete
MTVLSIYIQIYVYLVISYLWYRFLLRFIAEWKDRKEYPLLKAKTSIIIPVYNEKQDMLNLCIESVCKTDGNNEIIVVDDRSTDDSWKRLEELKRKFPQIKIIRLKRNRGKRHAQYIGLHFAKGDFIVTVDSDTILKKDAITELLKPFNNPKVGAVTGNIRAFNREYNLLTKMIDARYKNAFTFERRGLSAFGIVTCCSGVISAYKSKVIQRLKEEYISQKFLGRTCTYGDDRYLTNLFIKKGYKISYTNKAIAYTDVPTKFGSYIKQQLRWRKSFIRESFVILPFSIKNSFLLTIEVLFNLIIPFFSLLARLLIVYLIIFSPITLIPIVLSVIFIAFLRNLLLFFEEPSSAIYTIPYAFVHEVVIYWLYWIALFTLWNTSWGTR